MAFDRPIGRVETAVAPAACIAATTALPSAAYLEQTPPPPTDAWVATLDAQRMRMRFNGTAAGDTPPPLSTDATLSALSLGTGVTLDPAFAPGTTSYTADVANSVDEVTVTPTLGDSGASIEYLDGDDATLADAGTAADHQVALAVGDTVFKVKVTAEDTTTTQTYTVTVTRAAADTPTCTLNTGDIWCGVVTVGSFNIPSGAYYGYIESLNEGALSDRTFTVVPNDYTIDGVAVASTNESFSDELFTFDLTSALTAADRAKLVVYVGSDSFAFSAAEVNAVSHDYGWRDTGLDWSSGDPVTVRLRDSAAVPTTEVAIAADQPAFTGRLDHVIFTLTRTGDAAAALDVAVALTQDQNVLASGDLAQTVSFGAGDATATLTLHVSLFQSVTQEATLTATVQAGSGYAPGSPNTASTRILAIDPAVTAWIEETAYTFAEDATAATVVVILRTATGVPSPNREINLALSLQDIPGQAESGVDFESLSRTLRIRPSDFTSDGAAFTARQEVTLAIVDDLFDEPDETLTLELERLASTPQSLALRQADGTACRTSDRCDVTVTITDNDGSTDATLSALSLGTGVTLDPAFAPGTLTYAVAVGNAVDEVTVTPTLGDSGATIEYLDASDTTLADAGTAADHQVALAVGDTVFKVQVTAEDGTTTQTYTVTVTRAAADTPTCRLNPGDLWCGVVTVGAIEAFGDTVAYGFGASVGDLSDKMFSVGTNPYTIDGVVVGIGAIAGVLSFSLTSSLTAADEAELLLHVDGSSDLFAFSAAIGPTASFAYQWTNSGLSWSKGDYVTLRLRAVPTSCTLNPGDLWCGVVTVGAVSLDGTC